MNICPKCHQLMTWYMTYNCGIPYCGYHCNTCGYDTTEDRYSTYTSGTVTMTNIDTIQQKPIIQTNVVDVSDDSINKIADAVVQKLRGKSDGIYRRNDNK